MNNYQAEILLKSPKEEPKGREIQMLEDTIQAIELDVNKTAGSMEAETDQDNHLVSVKLYWIEKKNLPKKKKVYLRP